MVRYPSSSPRGTYLLAVTLVVLATLAFGLLPQRAAGQDEAAAAKALVPDMVGAPLAVFPSGALHMVGQEHFAIGLVDMETGPIEAGQVDLLFFKAVGAILMSASTIVVAHNAQLLRRLDLRPEAVTPTPHPA